MSSFKAALGLLLSLVVLAGCGDLPRPFAPEEKYLPIVRPVSPQAAEFLRERNNVVIQSIVNAPGPGGDRLAAAMAVALRNEGVAADLVAQEGGMTLAGIADMKLRPNDVEVRIQWYVLDAQGRRIGQHEQTTTGRLEDWQDANDRLLSRIALLGAPDLARLIKGLAAAPPITAQTPPPDPCTGKNNTQACRSAAAQAAAKAPAPSSAPAKPPVQPAAAPAKQEGLGFHVARITGAPGDGNDSLVAGMRLALGRRGFVLFAKQDNKSYVIAGKVVLTPFDQEREKITVTWTVSDPDNKKMGDIEQSNVIPKGALNGEWGGVAKEITVAAAEGLLDLLGKISQGKK